MRLIALLIAACRPPAPPPAHAPRGRVVVAHTNDVHAQFDANPAEWLDAHPDRGGYLAIRAHLDALRTANGDDAVIYLDAGDISTGTPLMEFQVHEAWGGAMLDFMETAGCAAWTLGNHELDRGYENAAALVAASPMPVLSANLVTPGSAWGDPAFPGMEDHRVFEVNGVRVGVFGLTTSGLGHLASAETMAHIEVREAAETARRQVQALGGEADLVVALSHLGVEDDRALASEVDGIDLIVGGHSHTRLVEPERVGDTWIVQAGSSGRELGLVEMDVIDGRVDLHRGLLVELDPESLPSPADPDMRALTRRWRDRIDRRFHTVIGNVEGRIDRAGPGETVMGRFAADVVRGAAGADVGTYNAGGLRADLAGGPTTLGDLYEVFPFANQVVSFDVTGAELVGLALRTAWAEHSADRGVPQWSGLSFSWRIAKGAPELVEVGVGGAPVDLDRTYRVATNSYVAEQWSYNLGFQPRNLRDHGMSVLAAAEAAVRAGGVVAPADVRNRRLGP